MSDYYKYTDDIPDAAVIERLVAGQPDVDQLIAIISRSYDYIRNLPLKGVHEDYSKDNPDLFENDK
ncbi:MAG: hypothetical protein EHM53_08170 [Methanoregulaceae archaeon]|nr:MAG: hypothetical protein EHM53_13565 [Methanoregulaceae archaeon]RPI38732.1 MAG: hypothetical protein EHM53_08170 [Methanoregulaceae archaeon]